MTFANNNRVVGWSYDAAGNLLNDGRNIYAYDAEGRIVALNGQPMYLYDAEGRRVAKYSGGSIAARYLLDLCRPAGDGVECRGRLDALECVDRWRETARDLRGAGRV